MRYTPTLNLPALDGTSKGKDVVDQSWSIAQALEAILLSQGQAPVGADLLSLLQRLGQLEDPAGAPYFDATKSATNAPTLAAGYVQISPSDLPQRANTGGYSWTTSGLKVPRAGRYLVTVNMTSHIGRAATIAGQITRNSATADSGLIWKNHTWGWAVGGATVIDALPTDVFRLFLYNDASSTFGQPGVTDDYLRIVYLGPSTDASDPLGFPIAASVAALPAPASSVSRVFYVTAERALFYSDGVEWKTLVGPRGPEGPASTQRGPEGPAGSSFPRVATVAALPAVGTSIGRAYYVDEDKGVRVSDGARLQRTMFGRWDESVGRRLMAWDENNVREQTLFGDTGTRDIATLLAAGVEKQSDASYGDATLRRIGSVVTMVLRVNVTEAGVTVVTGGALPLGFRPVQVISMPSPAYAASGAINRSLATEALGWYLSKSSGIRLNAALPAGSTMQITASWQTADPWPSTLPGAAVGVIPS